MKILGYLVFFIILILGTTFAYLNNNMVAFNYYVGQINLPLSLLLVMTFGVGIILGYGVLLFPYLKLRWRNLRLSRKSKIDQI